MLHYIRNFLSKAFLYFLLLIRKKANIILIIIQLLENRLLNQKHQLKLFILRLEFGILMMARGLKYGILVNLFQNITLTTIHFYMQSGKLMNITLLTTIKAKVLFRANMKKIILQLIHMEL